MSEEIPSEHELWTSVATTLKNVVLPDLSDPWAKSAAAGLIGIAKYAMQRPTDATAAQADELRGLLLQQAAQHDWVELQKAGLDDDLEVFAICGRVLRAAVERNDSAGEAVRAALYPTLHAQLDHDIAVSAPLVAAFAGNVDE